MKEGLRRTTDLVDVQLSPSYKLNSVSSKDVQGPSLTCPEHHSWYMVSSE